MALSIPLVFHLNQHLSEQALLASQTCYRGLLRVLRSHPMMPVNIQISGTLIDALKWLDPEPLQLIWEGLRAGQFELLGSTYAQNVPYASDDWDNARQIDMHLEVLHETFGVTPVTFWNPERCWRQSLLPIIADAGYRFTLVEDYTLAEARLAEPVVVTSQVGPHILTLLYDDQQLKHLFNFAVWFGRPNQLQSYLMARADQLNASRHCLAYAEDAEAMGLWGWREGVVPNQTWYRLDQVLSLLEALPEVQLTHLTNAPPSAGNLSPVPDGCATWMDEALEDPERPYHEPGYEDWFDFNETSPKLAHYRDFFSEIRSGLQALEEKLEGDDEDEEEPPQAAQALQKAALHNYLGHQYEFGCVGIGGKGYRGWDMAEASWALMHAAEWALEPQAFATVEDVNHDDYDEYLLSDGEQVIVTTPYGGRLLYWFDLTSGAQFIGNQRAVTRAPYTADAALPQLRPLPYRRWVPEEARPKAITSGARLASEQAPTRLDKFLPDWIWEGEREPFELLVRDMHEPGHETLLGAQRRAFVDYIAVDGTELEPGAWLDDAEVADGAITYYLQPFEELSLVKQYTLDDGAVNVTYVWQNNGDNERSISWRILNELCPAYASLVEKGQKVVEVVEEEEIVGVANTAARVGVFVIVEPESSAVTEREALLAREIMHDFDFQLDGGETKTVTFRLERREVQRNKKRRR
ncbi:MAG: hypothetical protein R3272_08685 [Candidatus Promineifilaceae bacterium]|nr:hypothetical protein [Candidatus Promineifilaceae bacterium]